jgi:hypothetical protein
MENAPDMKLRLPWPIRRQIEEAAKANRRSLNAEMVARLAASCEGERGEGEGAGKQGGGTVFVPKPPLARLKAVEERLRAVEARLDNLDRGERR